MQLTAIHQTVSPHKRVGSGDETQASPLPYFISLHGMWYGNEAGTWCENESSIHTSVSTMCFSPGCPCLE